MSFPSTCFFNQVLFQTVIRRYNPSSYNRQPATVRHCYVVGRKLTLILVPTIPNGCLTYFCCFSKSLTHTTAPGDSLYCQPHPILSTLFYSFVVLENLLQFSGWSLVSLVLTEKNNWPWNMISIFMNVFDWLYKVI